MPFVVQLVGEYVAEMLEVTQQQVAARAGHSVAVLLTVHATCLHGERDTHSARISAYLDWDEP